ncbi:MAG TPA: hypothetical protein PLF71_04035 [bacterium]|nr:hypothetical protein [bacterium]
MKSIKMLAVLFVVTTFGCSGAKKFEMDECADGSCAAEAPSAQPSAGSGGSTTNPPANDCEGRCSSGTSCVDGQCVASGTGGTGGSTTNPPSGTGGTNNTAGTGGSSGSGGVAGSGGSSNTGGSSGASGTAGSAGTAGSGGNTTEPCGGACATGTHCDANTDQCVADEPCGGKCATGTSCINGQCVAEQGTGGTGGSSGTGGSAGCAGEAGAAGTGGTTNDAGTDSCGNHCGEGTHCDEATGTCKLNEADAGTGGSAGSDAGTDANTDPCNGMCGEGTHCDEQSGTCKLDEQDAGMDADTGTDADAADPCNNMCGTDTHCEAGVCVLDTVDAGTGGTGGSSGAGGSGGTAGTGGSDSGVQAQPVTVECQITHPDNQSAKYYTYISDEGIPDGANGYYHLLTDWEQWGANGQPYTATAVTQHITFTSEWGSYIKINTAVNPEPGNFWKNSGCTSDPLAPALKYECWVTKDGQKKHAAWPEAKLHTNNDGGCDLYFTAKWAETSANDADGDGSLVGTDCNDADYLRRPGNVEVVEDGIDNDCYKGDLKKVRIIMDAPSGIGSDVHVTDWDKTVPMTYSSAEGGWVTALLPPSQMPVKFLVEYTGTVGACYQGMCYDCRQVNGVCSPQYNVYGETSTSQPVAVTLPTNPYSEGCRRVWDPYNQ